MSTSVAIAAGASAQAAAANAAAQQAKVIACQKFLPGFTHEASTVVEQKTYAECVGMLYPEPMAPEAVIAIKIAICLAFLGTIIGGVKGWQEDRAIDSVIITGLLGLVCITSAMFAVLLVLAGISFLITQ